MLGISCDGSVGDFCHSCLHTGLTATEGIFCVNIWLFIILKSLVDLLQSSSWSRSILAAYSNMLIPASRPYGADLSYNSRLCQVNWVELQPTTGVEDKKSYTVDSLDALLHQQRMGSLVLPCVTAHVAACTSLMSSVTGAWQRRKTGTKQLWT